MKDSFVLYTKYAKHMNKLSMEQRGILFTAIMNYMQDEEIPEMDAVTDMIYGIIIEDIEKCNEAYEAKKAARSEAGKKAVQKRWEKEKEDTEESESIPEDTNVYERIPSNTNHTNNENGNGNVLKTFVKEKAKKEKRDDVERAIKKAPEELHRTLREFAEMRRKIRAPMTERAMEMLIKKTYELSDGDTDLSRQILEQSILSGWKSVFPLKENSPPKGVSFMDIEF